MVTGTTSLKSVTPDPPVTSPLTHGSPKQGIEQGKEQDTCNADSASRLPPCPHMEIIRAYHEVLAERPRIIESRWKRSASERNLQARWREDERHRKLDFWKQFFEVVRTNDWWMGRENWKGVDLHWLVKRANFDKVIQHGVNLNRSNETDDRSIRH